MQKLAKVLQLCAIIKTFQFTYRFQM